MLKSLLADLREYSGIQAKRQISRVSRALSDAYAPEYPNGDDTAVVKTLDGYDLFAAEGFLPTFVKRDPWFAGWCGIMVNVSDIAAMGGRPLGILNTVWGQEDDTTRQVFEGMVAASRRFKVPILGGHTNLDNPEPYLGVSIVGRAQRLLSSFAAEPGQVLVAAVDLRGAFRQPFLNWNAATDSPGERLLGDLALLPRIAESGLATAAKDVSQAGLLGTALMLLESSNVGAKIDLQQIPKPDQVTWEDWLRAFPSYGYLLTTASHKVAELTDLFRQRDIAAAPIGNIRSGSTLEVCHQHENEIFWDLNKAPLTGLKNHKKPIAENRLAGVHHA